MEEKDIDTLGKKMIVVFSLLGMFLYLSVFPHAKENVVPTEQSISPFSYGMPSYVVPRKNWEVNYG